MKPILTTIQKIKKALIEEKRSLTVDELSALTEIPVSKIRARLTTFEFNVVRTGPQTYDLKERVYPGKTFRHTPSKEEIEKGILTTETDLFYYLISAVDFQAKVTLIDEDNLLYPLSFSKSYKNRPNRYYAGLKKWFTKYDFKEGDDLAFTCKSISDYTYYLHRVKKDERDNFLIKVRNKKLADLVYDILKYTVPKYEDIMFLIRKYLYIYPFNDPIPPDSLITIVSADSRFLFSGKDKMLSWTGHLFNESTVIGIKKYFYKNQQGQMMPVIITSDEYGKFGYCPKCNERLIWEKNTGWRHTKDELEYVDAYLDKDFFKKD